MYLPYKVNLRDSQKQLLARAIKTKEKIKLRLYFSQLHNGNDTLGLTKTQIDKIEKHKAEQKGVDVTLSACQVAKQGGFLGTLLLNTAKSIVPNLGISALEGLVSGLAHKIVSGNGCNYNEFATQLLPHLLKDFPHQQQKIIKEGGFVVPLLATLVSTLAPMLANLFAGKGYQVRPSEGYGYQVRPSKNYSITL